MAHINCEWAMAGTLIRRGCPPKLARHAAEIVANQKPGETLSPSEQEMVDRAWLSLRIANQPG